MIIYDMIKKMIGRSTLRCCLEELYMMIRTQQQKPHCPPQRFISAMLTALSDLSIQYMYSKIISRVESLYNSAIGAGSSQRDR